LPAYLDLFRIYGYSEDTVEEFQGLGGASMYASLSSGPMTLAGSVQSAGIEIEDIPIGLWNTQNTALTNQNSLLLKLAEAYSRKYNDLPQYENLWETLKTELLEDIINISVKFFIKNFIGRILEWLPGQGDLVSDLAGFLAALTYEIYEWCKIYYNEGAKICENMIAENNEALDLEPSWKNYDRRNELLARHEERINNIIDLINSFEARLQQSDNTKLVEALEDLQGNETTFQIPGIKIASEGKIIQVD